MIAFRSPEGEMLRRLRPSHSAIRSIWVAAVNCDDAAWLSWASQELEDTLQGAELVAVRFVDAISANNGKRAHHLSAVLGSFQEEAIQSPLVRVALHMRKALR